jgi:dipeptidyl aminopeptidase/acylaminoacyl peptidase
MASYDLARYLCISQAYAPSFASDGQRLAFLTDITGIPQVWQVALPPPGGAPLWPDQLTFGRDRVAAVRCSPAPGDKRILCARDSGGNEKTQLILLSPDQPPLSLTTGHEGAMHTLGEWSEDGKRILFAANRRDPALFDLYLQPLDGEARLVWQNDEPGYLFNATFSPNGKRAAVVRIESSFRHELFEVDLEGGTAQRLIDSGEAVRFTRCCYAPDGRSLYLDTDLGSDWLYVGRLDLESGKVEPLATPGWDCESLERSPDGRTLAYAVNVDGVRIPYLLDLGTGISRAAPGLDAAPGLVADALLAFSPDGSRLAFAYTYATRAADLYVWDLQRDRVEAVTCSSHGGIPPERFVAPQLIHYGTFDRDEEGETRHIPAWFYVPREAERRPLPVIVLVHGGPEGQYSPSFHPLIQYWVAHGYAVLAPNVRGSTGYGKAYSHLDDVEKRMDSVADLAHAAHWLRQQPEVDGERIVVYGGSYGGFMVLSALTAYPDLWAAGVDIVGISSLATFLENTSDYRRGHREAEYGSLARDRAFLEHIAPINHIDQIACPLFVIHGANDPRVPLSEAEQLVEALRARQVPVEFLVFDDEGHGIVKLENKLAAYPAVVDFLERHLFA